MRENHLFDVVHDSITIWAGFSNAQVFNGLLIDTTVYLAMLCYLIARATLAWVLVRANTSKV
jgi:hypothetical protein